MSFLAETNSFPSATLRELIRLIRWRFKHHSGETLRAVYELSPVFWNMEPELQALMTDRQQEIITILKSPVGFETVLDVFVNSALEFSYASNQFIHLDAGELQVFRDLYAAYLLKILALLEGSVEGTELRAALPGLLQEHFLELRTNLEHFFDPELRHAVEKNVILTPVVCAQYTPQFQLALLRLTPETLEQPVLDLGCGKQGALVQYLRAHGVEALGVDRLVEDLPGLRPADWMTARFSKAKWGTILSHMAFSHHFQFHHHYRYGRARTYARQYRALLDALKPGGSLVYTPGLPFIESLLGDEFQVVHWPVEGEAASVVRITRLC